MAGRFLAEQHGVAPWWWQTVAVTDEQGRKGRPRHAKPGGVQISASETTGVPAGRLFEAWHDDAPR